MDQPAFTDSGMGAEAWAWARTARARHTAFSISLATRRAKRHGDPVDVRPTGIAVGCARYPASREDNCLQVSGAADARQVVDDARPLVGQAEPAVTLFGPGAGGVAKGLAAAGWMMGTNRVMAMACASWSGVSGLAATEQVSLADTVNLSREIWAEDIKDARVVDQLVAREARTAAATTMLVHAVVIDGSLVASGQLRIDGTAAGIESVQTSPGSRGCRWGDAVLAGLMSAAQRESCDLVFLEADADDWPRHWYTRRGFRDVGSVHYGHLPATECRRSTIF